MKKLVSIIAALAVTMFFLNSIAAFSASIQAAPSDETEWLLEVVGLVDRPRNLSLSELAAMPSTTIQATIYCVDFPGIVVTTGNWTGVKLGFLLEEAGVSSSAIKVAFLAADGYSTDLSLEAAMQPDVIVAYEKDGAPLGEGLRLVVPGRWGYKWISQLTRIEIVDFDFKGKWESQGYSDDGTGPGVGRSDIPNNLTIQKGITTPQNVTAITPKTSPTPSNSSSPLPTQETQDPSPEAPETQNPEPLPIVPIAAASVAAMTLGAGLLVYFKKRDMGKKTNSEANLKNY